jgi:hypothetical protein
MLLVASTCIDLLRARYVIARYVIVGNYLRIRAGHQRTPLKNKLSSRKGASGRGLSRELFGARHPAAPRRRSGLAARLIPAGSTGRSRTHHAAALTYFTKRTFGGVS